MHFSPESLIEARNVVARCYGEDIAQDVVVGLLALRLSRRFDTTKDVVRYALKAAKYRKWRRGKKESRQLNLSIEEGESLISSFAPRSEDVGEVTVRLHRLLDDPRTKKVLAYMDGDRSVSRQCIGELRQKLRKEF